MEFQVLPDNMQWLHLHLFSNIRSSQFGVRGQDCGLSPRGEGREGREDFQDTTIRTMYESVCIVSFLTMMTTCHTVYMYSTNIMTTYKQMMVTTYNLYGINRWCHFKFYVDNVMLILECLCKEAGYDWFESSIICVSFQSVFVKCQSVTFVVWFCVIDVYLVNARATKPTPCKRFGNVSEWFVTMEKSNYWREDWSSAT